MNPGQKLDRLIAEKVMGIAVATDVGSNYMRVSELGEQLILREIPPYSTSIEAAWLVVEKMRESHYFLLEAVDMKRYAKDDFYIDKVYTCLFRLNSKVDGHGTADTAPHAICLAALKAVELDEVMIRWEDHKTEVDELKERLRLMELED